MEYLKQQEKMDCMAILKKQQNTNSISKPANLNITLHSIQANKSCCLCLQHNNSKCSTNSKPMKQNTTNNNCPNSGCTTDDRILTIYNYNIKIQKQQQTTNKQRPLTLSIAVIIMSLSILLIQMPTMVQSKSIYTETDTADYRDSLPETSAESESKLLLSLLAAAQPSEPDQSSSSASIDMLTSLDVLRHIQRTQEHQRERRMRLRKRHTGDLIITQYLHETGHNLEWKNPCNVIRVNTELEGARHVSKQQVYQYLKKLERDVGMEHQLISATANNININDMADWNKHDEVYKFLPKLNANGSIALSRWYRNMQVYVASFGYLARSQYKFDQKKRMFTGSTSNELNKLLASARYLLCELETTINGSAPNNNLKKLKTISRKAMNNRLNFVTKHQLANGGVVAANTVDLKFAKYSYFQYLQNLEKILDNKLQNKGKKYGVVDSSEESNSIVVGDDTSSLDFSSIFKSDSSLSVAESVEILLKTTKKPHAQRRRIQKKKNAKLAEA